MNKYMKMADRLYDLENQMKQLEETNNELKGKLVLSDMVLTDKTKRIKELEDKLMDKVCLESLDIVSGKIKQLEKENAELKLKLEALDGQTPWKDIKDKSEVIGQFTKAKEIIKELVRVEYGDFTYDDYSKELSKVLEQAERFLKDLEK